MRDVLTRVEESAEKRFDVVVLGFGLVLLLTVVLRASHLSARNLWFDEAWSWYVSQQPLRFILEEGRSNIHPPFLHVVLKLWTMIFGDGLAALRMPSVLASTGIVVGAYELGRRVLSRQAALLAAGLLALSPHQVFYAQEARMYALMSALVLGAVLAYVRFLHREGLLRAPTDFGRGRDGRVSIHSQEGKRTDVRGALGYMLAGALALYTHVFSALVLAAVNLHFFGLLWHRARQRELRTSAWASMRRWMMWQLGLLLLYAPWVTTFVYQVFSRPRQGWRPPLEGVRLVGELFLFLGKVSVGSFVYPQGVYYAMKNLIEYRWTAEMLLRAAENLALYPLAIGLGLFLLWRGRRTAAGAGLLQALFFIPVILICGVLLVVRQHMDFGRYLMMIAPYYFLLVAAGVMTLGTAWRRGAAIGLFMLPMLLGLKAHYRAPSFDSDYRPVAAVLRREWREGDQILVDPGYLDRCLRYELRGTRGPRALPSGDLPLPSLRDQLRDVRSARVWVVLDYRSPVFADVESLDAERAGWRIASDRVFPSSDPRVRLLRLERRAE